MALAGLLRPVLARLEGLKRLHPRDLVRAAVRPPTAQAPGGALHDETVPSRGAAPAPGRWGGRSDQTAGTADRGAPAEDDALSAEWDRRLLEAAAALARDPRLVVRAVMPRAPRVVAHAHAAAGKAGVQVSTEIRAGTVTVHFSAPGPSSAQGDSGPGSEGERAGA